MGLPIPVALNCSTSFAECFERLRFGFCIDFVTTRTGAENIRSTRSLIAGAKSSDHPAKSPLRHALRAHSASRVLRAPLRGFGTMRYFGARHNSVSRTLSAIAPRRAAAAGLLAKMTTASALCPTIWISTVLGEGGREWVRGEGSESEVHASGGSAGGGSLRTPSLGETGPRSFHSASSP